MSAKRPIYKGFWEALIIWGRSKIPVIAVSFCPADKNFANAPANFFAELFSSCETGARRPRKRFGSVKNAPGDFPNAARKAVTSGSHATWFFACDDDCVLGFRRVKSSRQDSIAAAFVKRSTVVLPGKSAARFFRRAGRVCFRVRDGIICCQPEDVSLKQ
jgi:hypothetical protein